MQARKVNCWEFMGCGRDKTNDCPAYPKGGRFCYLVAGTLCGGEVQGEYALKIDSCRVCDFYKSLVIDRTV